MNPFEFGTTFGFAFSLLLCLCFRQCQVTGMPVKMVHVRHCLVDIVCMYCSARSQVARLVETDIAWCCSREGNVVLRHTCDTLLWCWTVLLCQRRVGSLHWWYKLVARCWTDMACYCVVMQVIWVYWKLSLIFVAWKWLQRRDWNENQHTRCWLFNTSASCWWSRGHNQWLIVHREMLVPMYW